MLERIRTLINHLSEVKEVNALSDRDLDDLGMTGRHTRLLAGHFAQDNHRRLDSRIERHIERSV